MMKVSDPIIFGHCVEAYLGDLLAEHGDVLKEAGFNPNNGLSNFYQVVESLDAEKQAAIHASLDQIVAQRPAPRDGEFRQRNYQPACTQ